MRTNTKELVTTMGYLLGMRDEHLKSHYGDECQELLEKLYGDKDATIIRYLCKIRTALWLNFKRIDNAMRVDMKNLNTLEYFDKKEIQTLEEWGIPIIKANCPADKYVEHITAHISNRINNCEKLFYDWQRFDYIKQLFAIPGYTKPAIMKKEFAKYMANLNDYPFQMYIHWEPRPCGNLLANDGTFLKTLFSLHGEYFVDSSKYQDANEETKNNIYDFIAENEKTAIAVDCENSDVFKFIAVLRNLNHDELAKIEKITLYDDVNTTSGWDFLEQFTSIPVEHIEVERVMEQKSLVDVKMTAGVCTDYYTKGISAFILFSSDSDFWALISSLPSANFLVMYEYSKCSPAMKNMLAEHEYYCCSIDDFYSGNTEGFKKRVLFAALKSRLPDLSGINGKELAKQVYEDTRISATEKEMKLFFSRYVKSLRLKIDDDGNMHFEIAE